jgi:hypothetical protein
MWVVLAVLGLVIALSLACTVFAEQLAVLSHSRSGAEARLLLLKAASIPAVSVVFTYVHIWLALWMTFLPVNFTGCLRIPRTNVGFGWQGIVPFKALDFAKKACDNLIPNLISPHECVARVKASALVTERQADFDALAVAAVEAAVELAAPRVWRSLPAGARAGVLDAARAAAPGGVGRRGGSKKESSYNKTHPCPPSLGTDPFSSANAWGGAPWPTHTKAGVCPRRKAVNGVH